MMYQQGDIVEVNFLFPDGTTKPHPAIIVSNDTLQEDEFGLVYLVLISSKGNIHPQYSYPLRGDMLISHSFSKPSFVKCQIIAGYTNRDIVSKLGHIRQKYLDEIVDRIIQSIF